ncbi:MAG TPA: CapA family protein [Bacteroidales bacterium]|nr:CapA family protein [Bacteroidales bacterium]
MNYETSVLFLGDVIPYKPFRFKNKLKTIINLECPLAKKTKPVTGKVTFCIPENHLPGIFGKELLAVNLANNHILDYGIEGFRSTISELNTSNIPFFGINLPGDDSYNPIMVRHGEIEITILSAVSELTSPVIEFDDFNYLTLLESDEFKCRLAELKNIAGRLIIYIHWGTVDSSFPERKQVLTARSLIDAGADIIIGSHAHAPQPVERYKHGIIAYNLGNFIMPEFRNTPSFYDDEGNAMSVLTRKLMVWNRVSWGLEVDMKSLEFRVRKFAFIADRIIEFKSTIYDRYIDLHPEIMKVGYDMLLSRHLSRRKLRRKIGEMII